MKLSLTGVLTLCLLLLTVCDGAAADVSYFGVIKSTQYEQTNDASVEVLATNAYAFNAFAVASTNHVLTNATVSPPLHTLVPDDTNNISLRWMEQFNTQAELDAAYPNGSLFSPANYTVTMYTTNDGTRSVALNFFLGFPPLAYQIPSPTTPHLTNFAAAQAIDTTRDFQLGWSSLGGNTLTIVQLTVFDAVSNLVYMSSAPFQTGALSGASFSAVIPAYALPPGTNLIGHLTVANPGLPNTNSYAGATGISAVAKDTQFSLATRPAPLPPRLTALPSPATAFALRLEGESNRLYQIEATPDFQSWTSLFITNSETGLFDFTDSDSAAHPWRFYRAKTGQ